MTTPAPAQAVMIDVVDDSGAGDVQRVSGLLQAPPKPRACFVLAHGAGAGMAHPLMSSFAQGLFERGIATLRYQFPYMERKSRRPDPPTVAQATVRSATREAARLMPQMPLFAGGKSFGGRMTSQAQAAAPLPSVRGLVFLGFPLHPANQPSDKRAEHLADVHVPMLFLQGMRDALADCELLRAVVKRLGSRAGAAALPVMVKWYENADHMFHVPARSGRKDADLREEMLDDVAGWMERIW